MNNKFLPALVVLLSCFASVADAAQILFLKFDDTAASTTVLATTGSNGALNTGDTAAAETTTGNGGNVLAAFDFNGADDHVSFSGVSFATTVPGSLGLWFNPSSVTTNALIGNTTNNNRLFIVNSTTIRVRIAGGTDRDFTVPTMSTGTWYFLLVTKDSSDNVRLFLNGSASSSNPQAGGVGTWAPTHVGRYGGSAVWFTGKAAWLQAWDTDESANAYAHYSAGLSSSLIPIVYRQRLQE